MLTQTYLDTRRGEMMVNSRIHADHADIVYSTIDYEKFSFDPRNRPIRPAHLAKLIAAIEKKNLLRDRPILVDAHYTIIDGQHRLKAAQHLNVPVYFTFARAMTSEDVPGSQALTASWNLKDQLHSWCVAGNPHYLALRDFMNEYPDLLPNLAVRLCHVDRGDGEKSDTMSRDGRQAFSEGRYTANDLNFARQAAQAIMDFKEYAPKIYRQRAFAIAIINLMSNADYDHARMMQKVSYQRTRLFGCTSAEDYVAMLSEIYNCKTTAAHRVELRLLHWNDPKYRVDLKTN